MNEPLHINVVGIIRAPSAELWSIARNFSQSWDPSSLCELVEGKDDHQIAAYQHPDAPIIINGKTVDSGYGWCMAHPFNMLGRLPVLSVPSGIGGNGLPTGIQIVARHLDDERVFRVAIALEKAQPWLDCLERRPSI